MLIFYYLKYLPLKLSMNKHLVRFAGALLALHLLSACDSPSALVTRNTQQSLVTVRVNIQSGATAQSSSIVEIPDPGQLPESLRNSTQLDVIFDASKTKVNVQRRADGSLSFPLLTSRGLDSGSAITVLMIGDKGVSYTLQLQAGAPLALAAQPIVATPGTNVTLGTRLQLQAKLSKPEDANRYAFTWEVGPSAVGPFSALSGSGTSVEFEPVAAGSYYVRLGITDTATRSVSTYLTPTPLVYVQSPDRLAEVTPASGSIVAGEEVGLKAILPEFKDNQDPNLQWFFAVSAQGPFSPIAARGSAIRWEPPAAGSYFLRQQSQVGGRLSTYTSTRPEVLVATPDDVITTDPISGSVVRGQSISLNTTLPVLSDQASFNWFYSLSPSGPFTPLAESGRTVKWTPPLTGEFYLRLRTFDPSNNQTRTYTSSKTKVSVRDSNTVFTTSPDPASLRRGDTVSLSLNGASSDQVIWSFASNSQGPFTPISATGKTITWTPSDAGSFYLRAVATRSDGSTATFTSADALVFVAERSNVIQTTPGNGSVELGQPVSLRADISEQGAALRYVWSYSTSPTGTFTAAQTLESNAPQTVTWYPPTAGSYFVKVDITNPSSQSTVSFTSSEPVVRVSESQPFFSTDPASGLVKTGDPITIRTRFDTSFRNFNFGWAYGKSTAGPFTPIGGSSTPEVIWNARTKPKGTYYIRFQATAPGSDRTLTFVSAFPIVFVDDNAGSSGSQFGTSAAR